MTFRVCSVGTAYRLCQAVSRGNGSPPPGASPLGPIPVHRGCAVRWRGLSGTPGFTPGLSPGGARNLEMHLPGHPSPSPRPLLRHPTPSWSAARG